MHYVSFHFIKNNRLFYDDKSIPAYCHLFETDRYRYDATSARNAEIFQPATYHDGSTSAMFDYEDLMDQVLAFKFLTDPSFFDNRANSTSKPFDENN